MNYKTKILLRIVKNWKINEKPEYRGFKCGKCQKHLYKAWHYWLRNGGYKVQLHFCNSCQSNLKFSKIKGIYKTFICDQCNKKTHRAYHVWNKKGGVLFEAHFCKKCGNELRLIK